jgi:hypothetical protein
MDAGVVYGQDVRVIELAGRARLLLEAAPGNPLRLTNGRSICYFTDKARFVAR